MVAGWACEVRVLQNHVMPFSFMGWVLISKRTMWSVSFLLFVCLFCFVFDPVEVIVVKTMCIWWCKFRLSKEGLRSILISMCTVDNPSQSSSRISDSSYPLDKSFHPVITSRSSYQQKDLEGDYKGKLCFNLVVSGSVIPCNNLFLHFPC